MMEHSVHPYEPYIPEGATKLIIGTIAAPTRVAPMRMALTGTQTRTTIALTPVTNHQ